MSAATSRLPGFQRLSPAERIAKLREVGVLHTAQAEGLEAAGAALTGTVDHLVENVIGTLNVPIGIATNLIVDGDEVLVPMATEESSVIAAQCNGARQCRAGGGLQTDTSGTLMIAQVQLSDVPDPVFARAEIIARRGELRDACDEVDPTLKAVGGGMRRVEVRLIDAGAPDGVLLVVHLIVDTKDAMGANTVNAMAETVAPMIAQWSGGRVGLKILSNLADQRLVRVRGTWLLDDIGGPEVRDGMLRTSRFAAADPYRATTHNKGIMNGVSAVLLATGNDTRAVEAGAHAYAARDGQYTALSRWEADGDGNLVGVLEMPLAVGIVGGATQAHPTAKTSLSIMGIRSADHLTRIAGAVGLVQNFAALKALATEGIQRGHMKLHAKNMAMMAGTSEAEVDAVVEAMLEDGHVRVDVAKRILEKLRG